MCYIQRVFCCIFSEKNNVSLPFQDDESEESSSEEDDDDDDDEDETTLDESEAAETSDGQFRGSVRNGQALSIKDGLNYRSNTAAFKTDDETDTERAVRNAPDSAVIVFSGNDSDGPGKAAEFLIAQTKQKFLGNESFHLLHNATPA